MTSIGGRVLGAPAVALLAATAFGQQAGGPTGPGVRLEMAVEKVVPAHGDVAAALARLPPASAASGDQLVYTVTFTNVSPQPVDQVRVTNPLPRGVRYVADTANGPGAEVLYSVDGGATFGTPTELTVGQPGGGKRTAGPDDYTHIRWELTAALAPGATGFVRFSAIVR